MGHYEDYREKERIFDNNGKLSPRESSSSSGFIAAIIAVLALGLLVWGVGNVEVKPYVSDPTVSQLPGLPVPAPLPPTVPSPNT